MLGHTYQLVSERRLLHALSRSAVTDTVLPLQVELKVANAGATLLARQLFRELRLPEI